MICKRKIDFMQFDQVWPARIQAGSLTWLPLTGGWRKLSFWGSLLSSPENSRTTVLLQSWIGAREHRYALVFFGDVAYGTQGFGHARMVLYHWPTYLAPECSFTGSSFISFSMQLLSSYRAHCAGFPGGSSCPPREPRLGNYLGLESHII